MIRKERRKTRLSSTREIRLCTKERGKRWTRRACKRFDEGGRYRWTIQCGEREVKLKWGRHNCTRSRTGSRRTLGQGMSRRGEDKLRIRELAATHCLTQRLDPALIKYLTHPPPLRTGHNFVRIVITGRIGLRLRMSSRRSRGPSANFDSFLSDRSRSATPAAASSDFLCEPPSRFWTFWNVSGDCMRGLLNTVYSLLPM